MSKLVGKYGVLNGEFKKNTKDEGSSFNKYADFLVKIVGEIDMSGVNPLSVSVDEKTSFCIKHNEIDILNDNDPIIKLKVGNSYDYRYEQGKIVQIDYRYRKMELAFDSGAMLVVDIPKFEDKKEEDKSFELLELFEEKGNNTSNKIKIALISPAGGGKDFIADHLTKEHKFERYAFADNVKHVAKKYFSKIYSDDSKKPRALLQTIGTNFRDIDDNVWIDSMFEDIKEDNPNRIVVTDCRMPNEYEALKDAGFVFIEVSSSESTRLDRMKKRGDVFTSKDLSHETEKNYSHFKTDYSIFNHGSKDLAYQITNEIVRILEGEEEENNVV